MRSGYLSLELLLHKMSEHKVPSHALLTLLINLFGRAKFDELRIMHHIYKTNRRLTASALRVQLVYNFIATLHLSKQAMVLIVNTRFVRFNKLKQASTL